MIWSSHFLRHATKLIKQQIKEIIFLLKNRIKSYNISPPISLLNIKLLPSETKSFHLDGTTCSVLCLFSIFLLYLILISCLGSKVTWTQIKQIQISRRIQNFEYSKPKLKSRLVLVPTKCLPKKLKDFRDRNYKTFFAVADIAVANLLIKPLRS